MIQKLSEVFQIDISELLTGNIKTNKQNHKNKNIIIIVIITIIALLILTLTIIKINNTTDFQISKLASDNNLFHVKGIIAYSNNKKSIYISDVDYSSQEDQKEYLNLECVLYEVNDNIEKRISTCNSIENELDNKTYTLSELLKNIEINVDDYSCSCNTPVCNKLYLKINATNKKEETVTYNIPIELDSSCKKQN